jgi:hypothetical protein
LKQRLPFNLKNLSSWPPFPKKDRIKKFVLEGILFELWKCPHSRIKNVVAAAAAALTTDYYFFFTK